VLPFFVPSLGNCSQLSAEEKKAKHYERGLPISMMKNSKKPSLNLKISFQLDPKEEKAYHQIALITFEAGRFLFIVQKRCGDCADCLSPQDHQRHLLRGQTRMALS